MSIDIYGLCLRLWPVSLSLVCVSVYGLCLRLWSVLTLIYGLYLYTYGLCVHRRSVSPSMVYVDINLWPVSIHDLESVCPSMVCVSIYGLCL